MLCRCLPLLHHAIYMFCKIKKAFWAPLHPLRPGGKGEKPLCELSPTEPSWHGVASKERCFIDFSGCFSPFLFEKMLSPTEVMQKNCAWSWCGVRGQQAALHDSGLRNVQPDSAPASGTVLPRHPPTAPLSAQNPSISFQDEHPGVTLANWSSSRVMLQSRNGS